MTEIAVGIINFNTRELLRACLTSVHQEGPSKIVVVDNASSDSSVDLVKAEFPGVVLKENQRNVGFGTAANQAIAECDEEYILLLNSDTLLQPKALQALNDYLDRYARVGVAGPRLINPDGTFQQSCYPFPTPLDVFLDVSNISRLIRLLPGLRDHYIRTWSHDRARPVPWALGAALAIRRRAAEAVNGFDESYFMYYEEADLCFRLAKAGWQTHYAPVTEVIHIGGASTRQMRSDMVVQFYTSLAQFYRRHYSKLRMAELILIIQSVAFARLLRDAILLRLAREPQRRESLAMDISAWRRLLLGEWRSRAVYP